MSMLRLVDGFRALWSLFLAFFRLKPDQETALPVFSNGRPRVIGKPELISPWTPMQQMVYSSATTCGGPAGSDKDNDVRHPTMYVKSNLRAFYLPLDRLPSDDHQQSRDNVPDREYSLILPDLQSGPPPRPPRPESISVGSGTSVSEDEFGTPVIPNAHLPAVIVTPCTPSSMGSKTHISSTGDEISDENGESSGSDTCNTSIESNPFLSDPSSPLQKAVGLPILGGIAYHSRARSLTGTRRGMQHQPLSQSDSFVSEPSMRFSSVPLVADSAMSSYPVDVPLLIEDSVTPSPSKTSLTRSGPNVEWDSESQGIADERIPSYMYMANTTSKKSEGSTDLMLTQYVIVDTASTSTRHSEDPKAAAAASDEDATASEPTYENAIVMNQIITPSNSMSSLDVVPYPEVFDLDAYLDSDSSATSRSTLHSLLNPSISTGTSESKNSFPISPSALCVTFVSSPEPLQRISNVTDTTASSTSIYALSLSTMSTDTDESTTSNLRRFGSLHLPNNNKSKVTFNRSVSVKRYRDHYRPPAYSRPPAFVVESPTTSRKFTAKRASDEISVRRSSNKENENVGSPTSISILLSAGIANPTPRSPTCSCLVLPNYNAAQTCSMTKCAVHGFQPAGILKPQENCTLDSSTTSRPMDASIPVGKTLAILGPVAIAQRRQMDIFG